MTSTTLAVCRASLGGAVLLVLSAGALCTPPAAAQEFPARPPRLDPRDPRGGHQGGLTVAGGD